MCTDSGKTIERALQMLKDDAKVDPKNIVVLNLFATEEGLDSITALYPEV